MDRVYVAIDLKSFYASVECVQRSLDPLNTNLVVADPTRTEKTICLAVSPSLKSFDISGRARLFEVVQRVAQVNGSRRLKAPHHKFTRKSYLYSELMADPSLELDYIVATPQMAEYMRVSSVIYGIYLKYVAPEDIFAYSVDEVFIDATSYLATYKVDAHGFTRMLIQEVLKTTGITATAGIGPNMYLCKVAMDIVAKHIPADGDGVRIAEISEQDYKNELWGHRPITDFWRVGKGTAHKLEVFGIYTMGDIARWSLNKDLNDRLYKVFGKNAELLIDHAWGIEPTTIADVKAYRPENNSLSSGQVLKEPTDHETTGLIVWEMADALSLDLVEKGLVTDQIVLTIGYDSESLKGGNYSGEVVVDYYGRACPKHAHGTQNLRTPTASTKMITEAVMELFDRIADKALLSRRLCIAACNVMREEDMSDRGQQMDLFDLMEPEDAKSNETKLSKERALQNAMLEIKHKYGKNAIVKVKNLSEGGTAIERNGQIGGHRA